MDKITLTDDEKCDRCIYLNPKEKVQKKGEKHYCLNFRIQLTHNGFHPCIPKLIDCNGPYDTERHQDKK